MNCNIQNGTCTHCGGSTGGVCVVSPSARRSGLGDYTEELLGKIGVTPDRYTAVKSIFGLAPKCGCRRRKVYLNQVSEWLRSQ